MKVVLDTNVLVSGILKPRSKPAKIVKLILQGDLDIIINEHILSEYYEVLRRPKFSLDPRFVEEILGVFRTYGIRSPALLESLSLPDPADVPFLEAAVSMEADAIITGNKKHFPKKNCKGIKVATPSEFLLEKTKS